jgi:serine/threonine-protein kinase
MNVTSPLVLRSDVVLLPVAELAADVRGKFESEEGDYTITRMQGRMPSQVIDAETAALLQLFRQPRTIVEAVIENSRALQKDPELWFEELLPHIGVFIRNKVLVPADSDEDKEIRQLVDVGARVGEWDVLRCVSVIDDSEIYRVRRGDSQGALKIARAAIDRESSWFGNELRVLRHLDGRIGPRLLDSGTHEERPYLVIEWIDGADAGTAGAMHRHDRVGLLEIATEIVSAYAELHDAGVIHADVHPRNVLIDVRNRARIIDFGWSRIDDGTPVLFAPRAGLFYFFEPEYISGTRENQSLAATHAGEQYAIGALLYLMIAGVQYVDFRLERDEMMRQIETDPPLPFEGRGIAPWPELERILVRALAKDPAQRFGSVREMADALRNAHAHAAEQSLATKIEPHALALVETEIANLSRGGALFETGYPLAPKASVNFGAAGAAFGLLRIAEVRSDPKLLALAEVWATRAMRLVGKEDGWYDEAEKMPRAQIGEVTPYHTAAGLFATRAFLSHARGEWFLQGQWVRAFINGSRLAVDEIDLTLGRCGTLLYAAMLLEVSRQLPEADVAALVACGNDALSEVWTKLDTRPPIPESKGVYLGIAHGWSGYLYATLRWCQAAGAPLPEHCVKRLEELASVRIEKGHGALWPRLGGGALFDQMPGWCNGAAGFVFLWTLAHDLLRKDEYRELAEQAAWNAFEEPLGTGDLCCGSAGRAYSLLNLYRHTGEREWLGRARLLANHAATTVEASLRRHALWKGDLGIAVLIAELVESPETARMPLFE